MFSITSSSGAWLVVVLSLLSKVTEIVVPFGLRASPKFDEGLFSQPCSKEVMST